MVDALQVTRYATAVHPSALISPRAVIGEGTVVMHGAVVQSCARVGKHCIVNTGASVDHDCQLSDYVHIAPHATLSGNVQVGEGSRVGVGAVVKQGIRIGAWCTIGAGAVVVRDVPDGATVVGVPARVIKQNDMNTSVLKVTKSGGNVISLLKIGCIRKEDWRMQLSYLYLHTASFIEIVDKATKVPCRLYLCPFRCFVMECREGLLCCDIQ